MISQSINKRTLTYKSKLGFGKYIDLTIQDILNLKKGQYLRWVYFNYEGIDFIPEILDIIQITEEYRLKKPAKNTNFLEEINKKIFNTGEKKFVKKDNSGEEDPIKFKKKMKFLNVNKKSTDSKYVLLMRNHGHKI